MMKVLYYDCFCGISGDMNLAALLDLGVPKEYLIQEISKLKLDSEYEIKIGKAAKHGINGMRVDVILKKQLNDNRHVTEQKLSDNHHEHKHDHTHKNDHPHNHEHNHSQDNIHNNNIHNHSHNHNNENNHNHVHDHCHDENPTHTSNHEHHHRNLKNIENIINSSDLNNHVKSLSMNMFMKVAEAEAKVHGKTLYEVHFHEVGAIDSIIDMVGAAICLDYLEVDCFSCSSWRRICKMCTWSYACSGSRNSRNIKEHSN